jgi:hypothetical protein
MPVPISLDTYRLVAEIAEGGTALWEGYQYWCKSYLYQQIMRRTIIFIPKGETEPIVVVVHHKPELNETEHAGIWNIDTNDVWLSTVLWNQFPANDQKQQAKVFAQLHKMSNQLIK